MDSHFSHHFLAISTLYNENGVILYWLKAHASHLIQPLDQAFLGSIKLAWSKAVRKFQCYTWESVTISMFSRKLNIPACLTVPVLNIPAYLSLSSTSQNSKRLMITSHSLYSRRKRNWKRPPHLCHTTPWRSTLLHLARKPASRRTDPSQPSITYNTTDGKTVAVEGSSLRAIIADKILHSLMNFRFHTQVQRFYI